MMISIPDKRHWTHSGRLLVGFLVVFIVMWVSAIGGTSARYLNYHWAAGAVGIWLLLPLSYAVGTALEKCWLDEQ
jgi:hypothetical protein